MLIGCLREDVSVSKLTTHTSIALLTQACETQEEAEETIAHYLQKDGTEAYFKVDDAKCSLNYAKLSLHDAQLFPE
jgi:hypothetical protein